MIDLKGAYDSMTEDVESVTSWADELYQKNFAEHFKGQRELYKRLQSKTRPVTDEELEWILTTLPLEMFSVSEKISDFKLALEVVRMKNKEEMAQKKAQSKAATMVERKEEAELEIFEKRLVDTVYSSVLDQVDREVSFTRELIMSAKKIWDRRRATDESSPINPVDPQLPPQQGHRTFYEQTQAAKGQQPVFGYDNY